MSTKSNRFILKRTAVSGRIPTGTTGNEESFIKQGEIAINTTDKKIFSFNGVNVFEIGSNSFLGLSGGTISGNLTATTFYGSGSGLSDVVHRHDNETIYGTKKFTNSIELDGIYHNPNVGVLTVLSGLSLWLAANSGITEVGGIVSQWNDLSGNENHAIQNTSDYRPIFIENEINGLPVIRFDGSNDFMEFNEITDTRTAFFVVKHRTGSQAYAPILGHPTVYDWCAGDTPDKLFGLNTSIYIRNGSAFVNGTSTPVLSIVLPTTFSTISVITTGNVREKYITLDRDYIGSRCWDGDYAEIIIYNRALSSEERTIVEAYLSEKYSIGVEPTPAYNGFIVKRGNSTTDYHFLYNSIDNIFRMGVSGTTNKVSTREDTPIQNGFAYWSSGDSRFNTTKSITASTIISGDTNLYNIFSQIGHTHSIIDINNLSNSLNTKANLSGATFSAQINTPIISATTVSAETIYSATTDLYKIILSIVTASTSDMYFVWNVL